MLVLKRSSGAMSHATSHVADIDSPFPDDHADLQQVSAGSPAPVYSGTQRPLHTTTEELPPPVPRYVERLYDDRRGFYSRLEQERVQREKEEAAAAATLDFHPQVTDHPMHEYTAVVDVTTRLMDDAKHRMARTVQAAASASVNTSKDGDASTRSGSHDDAQPLPRVAEEYQRAALAHELHIEALREQRAAAEGLTFKPDVNPNRRPKSSAAPRAAPTRASDCRAAAAAERSIREAAAQRSLLESAAHARKRDALVERRQAQAAATPEPPSPSSVAAPPSTPVVFSATTANRLYSNATATQRTSVVSAALQAEARAASVQRRQRRRETEDFYSKSRRLHAAALAQQEQEERKPPSRRSSSQASVVEPPRAAAASTPRQRPAAHVDPAALQARNEAAAARLAERIKKAAELRAKKEADEAAARAPRPLPRVKDHGLRPSTSATHARVHGEDTHRRRMEHAQLLKLEAEAKLRVNPRAVCRTTDHKQRLVTAPQPFALLEEHEQRTFEHKIETLERVAAETEGPFHPTTNAERYLQSVGRGSRGASVETSVVQ